MRLEPLFPTAFANPAAGSAALDQILVSNATWSREAAALVWTAPATRSWSDVDMAVSALAETFASWRLGEDAVVGVQLGSSPQGALACLGLWRAGLIPAMLPLAWRRREASAALLSVGASAIVTHARGGGAALAEIACEIAAGLDTIRYVGCFGDDAPDGATPLDGMLDRTANGFEFPPRPEDAADHVAVVTFDAGSTPVARSHNELLSSALSPLVASRLSSQSSLVSTLDLGGLGGLATGLVCWLTSGCTATFHPPSDTARFAAALREADATHLALPGRLAARLAEDGAFDPAALSAVTLTWQAPDGRDTAVDLGSETAVVDVSLFGELGLHAAVRAVPRRFAPLALGASGPEGLTSLIELKIQQDGRLAIRGPACPSAPFPADPGAPRIGFGDDGFLETGLPGVADRATGRVSLGGKRRGVIQVGGLSLASSDVDEAYRRSSVGALPSAQPDALFGYRIALRPAPNGVEADADGAASLLDEAGFGPALGPVEALVEAQRRAG